MGDELYTNIFDYRDPKYPFCIIVGSRGCGKTFSGLRGAIPERGEIDGKLLFMRRTTEEIEVVAGDGVETDDSLQPFVSINREYGTDFRFERNGKMYDILHTDATGATVFAGKGGSLTSMHKVRGADFLDYTDMILDEAIPEGHIAKRRGLAAALLHAYETVCRNREFNGRPPVNMWILSNSDELYNEYFIELNIINDVEQLVRNGDGTGDLYYPERKLQVHLIRGSAEFQEKKQNTALACLTRGTKFGQMAYENKFAYNDFSNVEYLPLKGWSPVAGFDDNYYIYQKGSMYYICYARCICEMFKGNKAGIMGFRRRVGIWMQEELIENRVRFQTYEIKHTMTTLIWEGKYGF